MKIAAIGDVHFHNWKDYSKTVNVSWREDVGRFVESDEEFDVPMNSRLLNILNGLADVRDYCVNNDIKLLLFAGDLFHSRGSVETTVYNAVYKLFETFYKNRIEVIMISGNHDQPLSMVYSENSLYPFSTLHRVISEPQIVKHTDGREKIEILCLPYSKDKKMIIESEQRLMKEMDKDACPILLAHLGLSGGLVGSGNFVMSDEYNLNELKAPKFKYCIFGHYHKPQVLEYNSIYTGSLLQNTFNDEGDDHGFWVVDTTQRWDMRLVPLNCPKFVTIKDKNYKDSDISGNYIRIQASASDIEDIMSGLESDVGDIDSSNNQMIRLELEKDYDGESRSDVSITMTMDEILGTYISENNTTNIDDAVLLKKGKEIYNKAINGEV